MTTASVTRTVADRYSPQALREALGDIRYAVGDWAGRTRARLEASSIERWNSERVAMLESRGVARYK